MLEPLLGPLLVTLLAWAILLLALPELLAWLAARNVRQRRQLIQGVRRQESDLKSTLRQLEPFHNLQSPQYRQTYEIIGELLDNVQAGRRALVAMNGLRFPRLTAAAWPIRHFVSHPRDAADIVATWRRLHRLRRSLEASSRSLAEAHERLQQLHQMPEQFRQVCEAVLARLGNVQALLQEEQRAGVVALDKWRAESGRLQQNGHSLKQRLGAAGTIPLEQADQLGQELNTLEVALTQVEDDVQALHRNRLAFDERRQAVVAALANLGDLPLPLIPLADVVHTLLAETADLRQKLAFDQAEPLLETCERWLELGRLFLATAFQVGQLLHLQDTSLSPAAIDQVDNHLQQAYQSLAGLNALADRRPYTPLSTRVDGAVASLAATLVQIQAQAGSTQAQYKREAREQDQIAKGRAHELVKAWSILRRVMKPADKEPLATRYHSLVEQRAAASGKPAQLQAWAVKAAELRQDILESAGYLQYRLDLIGQWMNQLSVFLREVDANEATAWNCLQAQVAEIKRTGQGLQQRWKSARRSGRLDEIHERLDDIKLQYQQLQQDYQEMDRHLYHLSQMDGRIQETMAVIQETAANIDPVTLERMTELINSNYQRAYQATTYEETIGALQRAEEFANKLAMQ